jgi:hypothetical protein
MPSKATKASSSFSFPTSHCWAKPDEAVEVSNNLLERKQLLQARHIKRDRNCCCPTGGRVLLLFLGVIPRGTRALTTRNPLKDQIKLAIGCDNTLVTI